MRWIAALIEAAKAVWYLLLRKLQVVEPVFAGPQPDGRSGRHHAAHRPRQNPAQYPAFEPEDPILRVLRRRAASELFEWLGLDQIPKSYWTLLEHMSDPSRALIAFISDGRFDPVLVRMRDAAELAAFRNFVRFLCQTEEATDPVSTRQRARLDRHAHYGESAVVRSLLELFAIMNEAATLVEQSAGPYRFAAFSIQARRIAVLRENAVPADLPEVKALFKASRRHARLVGRFRAAAERRERTELAAMEQWKALSPHDRTMWAGLLTGLAQTQSGLMNDATVDVLKEVESFERLVEWLASLDKVAKRARDAAATRRAFEQLRRRGDRMRRQEEERRKQEQQKEESERRARAHLEGREAQSLSQDELLSIFGFPPGTVPGLGALRRAFVREASKTHPVFGQADYQERNNRYRILKDAYERLRLTFG